jgi:hypothetical protein
MFFLYFDQYLVDKFKFELIIISWFFYIIYLVHKKYQISKLVKELFAK